MDYVLSVEDEIKTLTIHKPRVRDAGREVGLVQKKLNLFYGKIRNSPQKKNPLQTDSVRAYVTIFAWPVWRGLLGLFAAADLTILAYACIAHRPRTFAGARRALGQTGGSVVTFLIFGNGSGFPVSLRTLVVVLSAFTMVFYIHFTCDLTAR